MSYLDEVVAQFNKEIKSIPFMDAVDNFNLATNNQFKYLSEADYNKAVEHLKLELLDIDRFIMVNTSTQKITNPVFYTKDNIPTDDGLLSNRIFGITQADRSGIFGYIDLGDWYIDPSCYKCWTRIDKNIKDVIHRTKKFIINGSGELVEDENGNNGIKWLKDNINRIKFKSSESLKRDLRIRYLEKNKSLMFINKYLVIPPYYRDTNTGKRSVGVGGVNKLYSSLIVASNSTKASQEYGFDMSGPMQARVQEILLNIYDWFAGNSNSTIQTDPGVGLSGKTGIIKRANQSKTSNYAARLVITAPDLKAYRPEYMRVDFDHAFIPLAATIACTRYFVQFHVRRFFENEFIGTELYPVVGDDGKVRYRKPKDPLIVFSDERIKTEMEKFINGVNNRFVPIEVPLEDMEEGEKPYYMSFKGSFKDNNLENETIRSRKLTWCDIFYMAACEAVKDKMSILTRYPVDSRFNEITTGVRVSSTKETEPLYVNGEFYPYYPMIKPEDIGKNTGNKFIDTLNVSNLYLAGAGADRRSPHCPFSIVI